ncbi:DUF6151 family protein [Oceaniglobus trochenteri]|uniref:DUF6151 family protein n=1 Tax=Oceaniglobus trochenteri TaxID=2763260 RepID=UPI001CFFFDDC|nr:DUF6151 family protein [Oceaniglobus trochenteri]
MAQDLNFACRCGTLRGVLHDVAPGSGCNLECYCADCRAFARHLGVSDSLTPGGGSLLHQTIPASIEITAGADRIACKRLRPKGLYRWYASCCDTPLANTIGSSRLPLAGMWQPLIEDPAALGKLHTQGFTKYALREPGAPKKDRGTLTMLTGLIRRTLSAYLSGKARKSPFFDAKGAPVVAPVVLTETERRAAYDGG